MPFSMCVPVMMGLLQDILPQFGFQQVIPLDDDLKARQKLTVTAVSGDNVTRTFTVSCRIDTPIEVDYFRNGGILNTVLRRLLKSG